MASSHQAISTTYTLNLLLSSSAEEFGLHNDRLLWELSLPRNFVVTLEEQRKGFIMHHGQEYEKICWPIHSILEPVRACI